MTLRRRLTLAIACVGAVALAPTATAEAATNCDSKTPRALHFKRSPGQPPKGRLFWHRPPGAAIGAIASSATARVIGQTIGRSASVSVKPGRVYEFGVAVVSRAKRVSDCVGKLVQRVRFRMPTTPRKVAARKRSSTRVTLEWLRSRRGDAPIVGYRVFRNGQVYKQVRRQRLRVPIEPAKATSFRVAAADTRGNLGHLSKALRVRSRHRVPGRPSQLVVRGVTDTAIAIGWSRAKQGSASLRGYRLYRDGKPVRQVQALGYVHQPGPCDHVHADGRGRRQTRLPRRDGARDLGHDRDAAADGRARACVPFGVDGRQSFHDLQRHYRQIGTVYPTYFDCAARATAAIPAATIPSSRAGRSCARSRSCRASTASGRGTLHRILTAPGATRGDRGPTAYLVARQHGYEGINIDFEAGDPAGPRRAERVRRVQLAARLAPIGKQVSVEVSRRSTGHTTTGRSGFYDYAALGRVADHRVRDELGLALDDVGPGAPDDIELARSVADYVATMPNSRASCSARISYGMDWPNGGGPQQQGDRARVRRRPGTDRALGARPVHDPAADGWVFTYRDAAGVHHEVWYPDARHARATHPARRATAGSASASGGSVRGPGACGPTAADHSPLARS